MQRSLSTTASLRDFFTAQQILCFDAEQTENPSTAQQSANWRKAFLHSLAEFSVAMGFAGATACFIPTDTKWYVNPFTLSGSIASINLLIRLLHEKFFVPRNYNIGYSRLVRSFLFANMDTLTRNVITHEGGHFVADLSLLGNAQISITPNGLFGDGTAGITHASVTLNDLGKIYGEQKSRMIISASGPLASIIGNYLSMIVAQALPDNYPEIKTYLRMTAAIQLLLEILNVVADAIKGCEKSNDDYCFLEKGGISLVGIIACIAGTALLLQLFLSCVTHCCKKTNQNTETQTPAIEEVHTDNDIEEASTNNDDVMTETDDENRQLLRPT